MGGIIDAIKLDEIFFLFVSRRDRFTCSQSHYRGC